ncbi:SDR family NAD(P)-dependent oxidoreductase [Leptospira ilyithenensis]|uniref:SDR family oxidoreductase n=1 Tax=Leptospira ilyithenensis TaxID=2484901 RepID=A0A4R9LN56_9LEPT|nr:SDR family oxidoreductase [Leptospira ilyithenensis]TGN08147.1 SDR family oxidoreductase [Leptospira ilyithenensis]
MDLGLKDKKVLITGSSKGIGFKIAEGFGREGSVVYVNGRTEEAVDQAIKGLKQSVPKGTFLEAVGNVSTEEGISHLQAKIGEVDVLINNAGFFEPKSFFEITREDWTQIYETNVLSGARLTQIYLKGMIKRNWGRVIFISSESAINIPVEMVHYGMSKTAQLSIARGSAELCKGTNVTVNSILPGPTLSEGVEQFIHSLAVNSGKSDKDMANDFIRENRPSSINQRFAKPEEIADVVVFLASEKASMINGSAVRVDGGVIKSI